MKRFRKGQLRYFIFKHTLCLLVASVLVQPQSVSAQVLNAPHVLVLNSYHPQYVWSEELTKGIKDTLAQVVPPENIHIEFLDTRRFTDDMDYENVLLELIRFKYISQFDLSLVLTNEDFALDFALKHHQQLFPGVPVVFNGVNGDFSKRLANQKNFTGIYEGLDFEGNVALIRSVHDDIKKLVVISDRTSLGKAMTQRASAKLNQWQHDGSYSDLKFELLDNYNLSQLQMRLVNADKNTVFLLLVMIKDNLGRYFSYHEDLPVLSQKSRRPIYSMWGPLVLGRGAVGGNMVSPYLHGENTAKVGIDVLSGKSPEEIPIRQSAEFRPYFDFQQMQRFGIRKRDLPTDTQFINLPGKDYEKLLAWFIIVSSCCIAAFLFSIFLIRNIRRRIDAEEQLSFLAYHDEMTGIGNKNALLMSLCALLDKEKKPFTLALIDIDGFKYLNEKLGHDGGDALLKGVAKRISDNVDHSYFGRYGGDEFFVIFQSQPEDVLADFTGLIKKIFREPFEHLGEKFILREHTGLSQFPKDGSNAELLIKRAETAMYEAKRRPEIKYCAYSAFMSDKWNQRLAVEAQINHALKNNGFKLFYQAKINAQNNLVIGAEALLRMCLPNGQLIGPDKFIPIAEQSHLIRRINRWVCDQAVRDIQMWHECNVRSVPVSINISSFSLYQQEIADYLGILISEKHIPPHSLEIELTESTLIHDLASAKESLSKISQLGVCIAIDDFGTGWSNLSYLRQLPIDHLKIDRSFIANIDKDVKQQELVLAMRSLAHSLGSTVIVEGVETQEQVEILRSLNCNTVQGYYYSRPLPENQFTEILGYKDRIRHIY